ncbi:MAG TPA: hypothetical protein VHY22_04685 [Chthoniobacteraceae bacterium]|jgi:hypothetical protein|nr:hypothetical protein [Chthoniobacteraceae bacterium]
MKPEHDISNIGAELVEASRNMDPSPGEVLGELFPYVYDASRRMSTRRIRDWLKENHGIEISQPTLSRALRNPEKYWRAFADYIEPWARRVEEAIPPSMEDFLFDGRIFDHFVQELPPSIGFEPGSEESVDFGDVGEAVDFLEQKWFVLSEAARAQCRRYLREMRESESESEGEDAK